MNIHEAASLAFDEATHTYRLGDMVLPSVTQVLRAIIPQNDFITAGAMERGSAVHIACELWDKHYERSGWMGLNGYLGGWIKFCDDQDLSFDNDTEIEKPIYHPTLFYAGTVDRISWNKILIDIKTGAKQPWHRIQTAAYVWMLPEPLTWERMCVYLDKEGGYKIETHAKRDLQADVNIFLSALTLHNWRRMNGIASY